MSQLSNALSSLFDHYIQSCPHLKFKMTTVSQLPSGLSCFVSRSAVDTIRVAREFLEWRFFEFE